jgi:LCP family protein required for cell wall assembly
VSREASHAGGDETVPYDRELIRSGGRSSSDRRRRATGQGPPLRRAYPGEGARRSGAFPRAIRWILLLVVIAVLAGGVLLGTRAAAFNSTVTETPFVSTALLGPLNGSDRVNVMMVGYGGADHDGAYLADSIQVLSIDPQTDTTTTIPIPRDLWIEGVDSFSQNGKVNETFAVGQATTGTVDGAAEQLADVVSAVTGLEIEHWLTIDFEGFREMVDAVGGVTVDNPTGFCWTTVEDLHLAGRWEMGCFEQGLLELDGDEALTYARARYTSVVEESTDFARSVRQARIISALRGSLGEGGIGAIGPGLELMDAMEGRVRTDLSVIDLFLLSGHMNSDRRLELTEGPVLTATRNTIGQYILIPTGWTGPGSYGRIHAYLEAGLAEPLESPMPDAP